MFYTFEEYKGAVFKKVYIQMHLYLFMRIPEMNSLLLA